MSSITMDEVQTMEELQHDDDLYNHLLCKRERDFLQAEVGVYFLLSEEDKKIFMQYTPTTDLIARTQQIIRTFESAELPDLEPEPPVKKKRGRPRKRQYGV